MCGIMQVGELKSLVGIAMCGIMQTEGLKLPTSICDAVQAWGTFSLLYPLLPLLTIPASCLAATSHSPPASHHSGFLPSKHHSSSGPATVSMMTAGSTRGHSERRLPDGLQGRSAWGGG